MSELTSFTIGVLEIARVDGIALVTINRPEKLNALGRGFWGDLVTVLNLLAGDGSTRAIVLTGAGAKSFSAGGDIGGFAAMQDLETLRALQNEAMNGFMAIERCPLLVIAAVNGYAFGGGFELVLACDFAIAAETAVFSMPEATLGLLPGFGVIRAPQVIGRRMTRFLVATGDKIDATRAYEIGLVQKVVKLEVLIEEAKAIAKRVVANSPLALRLGKYLMSHGLEQSLVDSSVNAVTRLQCSADRKEGVAAFMERRPPNFEFNSTADSK